MVQKDQDTMSSSIITMVLVACLHSGPKTCDKIEVVQYFNNKSLSTSQNLCTKAGQDMGFKKSYTGTDFKEGTFKCTLIDKD